MKPVEILERLVRNYWGAVEQPEVSRACMFAGTTFSDGFIADFVTTLVLCSGDVDAAIYEMRGNGHPQERVTKLREWCSKVKRGER